MKPRIPLAKPEITEDDRNAVLEVLRTSDLSMGPKLREFEQAVCDYTGAKFAVALNSGTSALHLALRALDLPAGSEVILPSFSFSALLNVVAQEGLRSRFVDIDPQTYNTTPELVDAAITPETRLIFAVHTFGIPVHVDRISAYTSDFTSRSRRHPVHVIEDACEALGAEVRNRKAGSIAPAGAFAFYPNKQITTGEGGVLVTSEYEMAQRARKLRSQGRNPELDWLQQDEAGFSYRISDINCALGISQLRRIEDTLARRQSLAETYDRELAQVRGVVRPPLTSAIGRISWFVYPLRLTEEFTSSGRDAVCRAMAEKGIATGRYFSPLHLQPLLRKAGVLKDHPKLPHTEFVADRILALPFFNELKSSEIQEVCCALDDSVREVRRRM